MPDWFDDHTLDWIHDHDIENVQHVVKHCKLHKFRSSVECRNFVIACVDETLRHLGVDISSTTPQSILSPVLEAHNVKIERRVYKSEYVCGMCHFVATMNTKGVCPKCGGFDCMGVKENKDEYRSGVYVYKDNEIVAFVTEPRRVEERRTAEGHIIINDGSLAEYLVKTNVRP